MRSTMAQVEPLESRRLFSAATGSIAGLVFDDANLDGARGGKERAIAGVRVFIDGNNNGTWQKKTERSVLTDKDGRYKFDQLAAGRYTVRQVVAADKAIAKPSSGVYRITIGLAGRDIVKRDFADVDKSKLVTTTPGVITGSEYLSGGSITVSGPAIELGKLEWYGLASRLGGINEATYSRIDAAYSGHLTGWDNGDFDYSGSVNSKDYVQLDAAFAKQSGKLTQAVDYLTSGASGAIDDSVPSLVKVADHVRQFGQDYTNAFLEATTGKVSGVVYMDLDRDGTREKTDRPLANKQVFLEQKVDRKWVRIAEDRTDAFGVYQFAHVAAGDYRIREAPITGLRVTRPSTIEHGVYVSPVEAVVDRNFANVPL